VVWLDGLDIPIVRFLDCGFAQNYSQASQPVSRPEGDSLARFGNNLLPIDYEPASRTSPVFAYPYARTRESLEQLQHAGPPHPAHAYKMQFVNPATGGYAMPTMATFVQLLPAGFAGQGYRSTDGAVFHVIEGEGAAVIGDQRFALRARDTFVVPAWQAYRFEAVADTVLFSFSDRPVQRALDLWRQELQPA
jgi:gentisate 1,2-dioxygenase